MKAWTVYWAERVFHTSERTPSGGRAGGGEKKTHGCTTVVSDRMVSALILFNEKYPKRDANSISSEADDVLFDD